MKGVINIIEVLTAGIILLMALIFFFPHYSIKSRWNSVLLSIKVRDTMNTIDRMNKTYDFAKNQNEFDNFMKNIFTPSTSGALIWWKNIQSPNPNFLVEQEITNLPIPYFTEAQKETVVDVGNLFSEYPVDSNTGGLWHFNEGTGTTAKDNTTFGNDGTLYDGVVSCFNGNCPTWVDGKFGKALKFDGINDCVGIPNSPTISFGLTDNYTVEAWIRPGIQSTLGTGRAIVEKINIGGRYPYVLRYSTYAADPSRGSAYFAIYNGTLPAGVNQVFSTTLLTGVWYHIAGVKDGNFIRMYVNGTLVASTLITVTGEISNNDDVYIGRREDGDIPFNGTIDEVRISNVARKNFGVYNVYDFTLGLGYPY